MHGVAHSSAQHWWSMLEVSDQLSSIGHVVSLNNVIIFSRLCVAWGKLGLSLGLCWEIPMDHGHVVHALCVRPWKFNMC